MNDEDKKHTYFKELNKEFGKYTKEKYYYYDFVLSNKKKCIEFNGTYWHRDPRVYEENSIVKQVNKTAKEIWKSDKIKIDVLKKFDFKILIIWELDYKNNKEEIINKCINFLKDTNST